MKPLEKAVKMAGSRKNLAKLIGIAPMSVTHWQTRGVPLKRCIDIERVTNGHVTRYDLCPEVFGLKPL